MPQEKKYQSRYGGGLITESQYLAEIACERIAGGESLGHRFWRDKPWSTIFVREITHANRLLRDFSLKSILISLSTPSGRKVRTLGAKFFKTIVEVEQRKLDLQKESYDVRLPENINTLEKPRPIKKAGKSIRERLAEDNGETK